MRYSSKASFLRAVALLFLLCTLSSVFARVPLVRRQSNVESLWALDLPGGVDGTEMENNKMNEQVVADKYPVCCQQIESLIDRTYLNCEGGMSFSLQFTNLIFFSFSSQTLLPIYLHLSIPSSLCILYGERKEQNPTENLISNHEIMLSLAVTSESICDDGTLYDCPIPAYQYQSVSKYTHPHHTLHKPHIQNSMKR